MLLPNLTNVDITINSRLDNLLLLNKEVFNAIDKEKCGEDSTRLSELYLWIIIERFRCYLSFEYNLYGDIPLTMEQDSMVHYIFEWAVESFGHGHINDIIIKSYTTDLFRIDLTVDNLNQVEHQFIIPPDLYIKNIHHFIDIINFSNRYVEENNINVQEILDAVDNNLSTRLSLTHFFNKEYTLQYHSFLPIIDIDTIYNHLYEKQYHYNTFLYYRHNKLINALSESKKESIKNKIKNIPLFSNHQVEVISVGSVIKRLEYIDMLSSLVVVCPSDELEYLSNYIRLEYTRIQCISIYLFVCEKQSIEHPKYKDEMLEFAEIFSHYLEYGIDKIYCGELLDLIYFQNHLISMIPNYDESAIITMENIEEHIIYDYNFNELPTNAKQVIDHIRAIYRENTLYDIIK